MNSAWSVEFIRIVILLVSTLLVGIVTDYWLISVIIHGALYSGWNLYQLRTFERWIRQGAAKKHAPDTSGVWQLIVQHIYRSQKSNKDRKQHLAKVANHYHAVMSALPDATIVYNKNLEIEWANKRSHEILGIDPVKDAGQRIDNILRDLEIQKLFKPDNDINTIEISSPLESHITLLFTKTTFGDDKNLLIARDISQRVALQSLRKAFIANASHELRTPLTVISGYLEIMDAEESLPASIENCITNALQQALRMDQTLNDLLVLSKLEEKRYSEESGEVVDVPALLQRLVSDFEATTAAGGHRFELNFDPNLKLKVVETEFYSLCQNLVSNAVKYSAAGTVISIDWRINFDDYACLSVIDKGEGIEPEYLSRLTERFYRINAERNKKIAGTGLGLSIVKHILDNFGGYLDIESEIGVGSIFSACFPKYRAIEDIDSTDIEINMTEVSFEEVDADSTGDELPPVTDKAS